MVRMCMEMEVEMGMGMEMGMERLELFDWWGWTRCCRRKD